MFGRKPRSPAKAALADTDAAIAGARQRIAEFDGQIAHLQDLIDGEAGAQSAIDAAVAADGVDALQRIAEGRLDLKLTAAEAALRGAAMARRALPALQQQREAAAAALANLEAQRHQRLGDALLEAAEPVARAYLDAFRRLCALQDELAGLARVVAGFGRYDIAPLAAEIEATRFQIAPLLGADYSPIMSHRPGVDADRAAEKWRAIAARLAANPKSKIAGSVTAVTPAPGSQPAWETPS